MATSISSLNPLLRPLYTQAQEHNPAPPCRFVFVIKSSGLDPSGLRPTKVGVGPGPFCVDHNIATESPPPSLAQLEAYKDQLLVLEGLSGANFSGNHSSYYGALSCRHAPDVPVAATIDCVLGNRNPAPFPNVGFSPNGHSVGNNVGPIVQDKKVYPKISAYGPNQPMAFQASAVKAYRELFGMAASGKSNLSVETNLLDFLADDVGRVARSVGQQEREKLGHYLSAFEDLRARNEQLNSIRETIAEHSPTLDNQYTSTELTDRVSAYFELTAAALIAGLTNVVTIRADWLSSRYGKLGFGNTTVHDIGHHRGTANGLSWQQARDAVRQFQIAQIARLAKKLAAVPEGDGSMLDNTLIVYLSDGADAHHSNRRNWPFVLLGGRNLGLKNDGRYLCYPDYGERGHKTIGNLYNTLLYASGVAIREHFGERDPKLRDLDLSGPLDELL